MGQILAALSLIALVAVAFAEGTKTKDWSFSLTSTVTSEYIGGTGGGLFSDKPCWQTGLYAFHKSGFYAGVWRSLPVDPRYGNTFANETDYSVGYNRDFGKFNVDLSTTLYDFVPVSDMYAVAVIVSANSGKVKPYFRVEYDAAQSARMAPLCIWKIGAKGNVPKTPLKWDLWLLGRPYSTGKRETLSAAKLQLCWPINVGHGITVTPGVLFQESLRGGGPTTDHEVYSVACGLRF